MSSGVLFVSPHPEDANRLLQILRPLPVQLDHVQDLSHARTKLEYECYPVILTDSELPDGAWPDVLDLAREKSPDAQVILTSRFADARLWTEALGRGVYDLLAQPFEAFEVRRILASACRIYAHRYAT
jgi:DNA-binding NtrC family response regulator